MRMRDCKILMLRGLSNKLESPKIKTKLQSKTYKPNLENGIEL